jgi:uncharacterized protein YheU (UPF0270 family)
MHSSLFGWLLTSGTLRAFILEFVIRDGTDHTTVEPRIEAVLQQLRDGSAELHFDDETRTWKSLKRSRNALLP